MTDIKNIRERAESVKDATQVGENTAERVGGVLVDMADKLSEQATELAKKANTNGLPTDIVTAVTSVADTEKVTVNVDKQHRDPSGSYTADDESVILDGATETEAGVMSAADKKMVNSLPSEIVTDIDTDADEENLKLLLSKQSQKGGSYDAEGTEVSLPCATETEAGVMSAADKKKLEGSIGSVDISHLDELADEKLLVARTGKPVTYAVTQSGRNVGTLILYGDSMGHGITQILQTSSKWNSTSKTFDRHSDGVYYQYCRFYNLNSPYLEQEKKTWSEWSPYLDDTAKKVIEVLSTKTNGAIKCIWRLEGGEQKEFDGNIEQELDEFLISQGNYAALCVTIDQSKLGTEYDMENIIIAYDRQGGNDIFFIDTNNDTNPILYIGDNHYELNFGRDKKINIFIYRGCIEDNDFDDKGYYLRLNGDGKVFDLNSDTLSYILCSTSVYAKFSLIPFASNNNYAVKYADGRVERFNKTDNVRIGGEVEITRSMSTVGFVNGTFRKNGSLNVNGTLKARDTAVRSLDVNGTLNVSGRIETDGNSIHCGNLEANETTINGTLHVENYDIKTQSLYPAKTGSSTLKDASKGKVKGNYKVSAGNLGKGAHNYDKLFVKNIMWSDQTDITSADTSLNGEGTIQVWSKEGFDKSPTLWVQPKGEESATCGVWNNGNGVTFEKRNGDQKVYSVTIDNNGRLKNNVVTTPFVWGNGKNYDSTNKIPQDFVNLNTLETKEIKLKSVVNEFNIVNIENNLSSFDISCTGVHDSSKRHSLSFWLSGFQIYNINKEEEISLMRFISQGGKRNQLYAADGSVFDINTKADLVDGAVQMEQMPNDVRKTVQRAKKREVRYIPFKAISMKSVNDGRYENRYVYNDYELIPLYIEKNVKRVRISVKNATVKELFFDRQNLRHYSYDIEGYCLTTTVEKDGDDFVLSEYEDFKLCCNVKLELQKPENGNTTYAFKPISYSVNGEGLAVIEIEAIQINDSVKLGRMDYRLLNGKIKYTGVVPKPMLGSIIDLTPKIAERNSNLKNIYKAVLTCNRIVRKGKSKRVKNAKDKNLYLDKNGQTISRKKKMYQGHFPFRKEVCRFTLAALKRDKFGHKSILGFKEYKVVTSDAFNDVLKVE